jgi:hypothetical protein
MTTAAASLCMHLSLSVSPMVGCLEGLSCLLDAYSG